VLIGIQQERPELSAQTQAARDAFLRVAGDLLDETSTTWHLCVALVRLTKKLAREEPRGPEWREHAAALMTTAQTEAETLQQK
jgi:hypothetical protein